MRGFLGRSIGAAAGFTHYRHPHASRSSLPVAHLVARDARVFPWPARADILRRYFFPDLSHHGIRRALQLIGVAVHVAIQELRGVDACGRRGGSHEG